MKWRYTARFEDTQTRASTGAKIPVEVTRPYFENMIESEGDGLGGLVDFLQGRKEEFGSNLVRVALEELDVESGEWREVKRLSP